MTQPNKHFEYNAMLNLLDDEGKMQLGKDQEALSHYFEHDVNKNTVFFHSLEEKLKYLVEHDYYEKEILEAYSPKFIKKLFKQAYDKQFRFKSFVGAYKYYRSYTLSTFDGERYLERYEDRVCMTALYLAQGDEQLAKDMVDEVISNRFQPATPTFLNAGRKSRGEMVSCFLLRIEDNMESIARSITSALQLSKRGGGVAFLLSNIREKGAPIKNIEGQSSGVIPIMKMFEDAFSYANQLGSRTGAGAVYLNAHHPDIMDFLDTKRENADEKIRIKTLSTGVVIPDITYQLAKGNKEMYLFSPYDVENVYGKAFADISVTEMYDEMVDNPNIRKKKIKARDFFLRIAQLQFESGYPFILNEDHANSANPVDGRINMSNLCVAPETKILTREGYVEIEEVAGESVDIWNGREWSNVDVIKTGENQKLLKVVTSMGMELECTPYHKWFVQEGFSRGKVVEKRTHELKVGDKLIKVDSLPIIQGEVELRNAYANGFYTGDGCLTGGHKRIYLYHEKRAQAIKDRMGDIFINWHVQEEQNREYGAAEGLRDKFFVPTHSYTIESRLEWLAGLFDSDGTVARNGKTQSLQLASINKAFLEDLQMMLQTLGVVSRINFACEAGMKTLPANDGTGELKEYYCQAAWRILIGQHQLSKLIDLGIKFSRLSLDYEYQANRECGHFNKIVEVIDEGRTDDTYCFTEHKRGMGMFNGILTSQCSEILQVNTPSTFSEDGNYVDMGKDISCNLGSMNVALAMESKDFAKTVSTAIRGLTAVSDMSNIKSAPSVHKGNKMSHAVGLGQMNLHGFFAREKMYYGSPESVDFTDMYFYTVAYHAYKASNQIAKERGQVFDGFERSQYANGKYFEKYTLGDERKPTTQKVVDIFAKYGVAIPSQGDWKKLSQEVIEHGLYHSNLQAVPPTGSISYLNNSTASIHPVAAAIEKRKEGKMGTVYYPAPFLSEETLPYYQDAYEVGYEKTVDVYAAATEHVDQGLSLTLFFPSTATTRDVNKAQIYAWKKGIKTLYYIRVRQAALAGTEVEGCVSCTL